LGSGKKKDSDSFAVACPRAIASEIKDYLRARGCELDFKLSVAESVFCRSPGALLREAREGAGLTQEALGRLCGLNHRRLSALEKGREDIGEEAARKLAAALGIDWRLLYWGESR
jgi:DNA-binding XRE family transcriptional regulator